MHWHAFFTVYGPWERPDMAPMIFADSIFKLKPIKIFNYGKMKRDFTFIDDVTDSIIGLMFKPAVPDSEFDNLIQPGTSWVPHRIFNIGNANPINLMDFIMILENEIGIKAIKEFIPMQEGDVESTYADTTMIKNWINYSLIQVFQKEQKSSSWFKDYYQF